MKYNSGDIDDLFRRASEDYPLRTDSADWDRLASALDADQLPSSDKKDERRRRKGIIWWFLLIPFAGIGYFAWHTGSVRPGTTAQTAGAKATKAIPAGPRAPGSTTGDPAAATAAPGEKTVAPNNTTAERQATSVAQVRKLRTTTLDERPNTEVAGLSNRPERTANHQNRRRHGAGTDVTSARIASEADGATRQDAGAGLPGHNAGATPSATALAWSRAGHDPALALLDLRPAPIAAWYHPDVDVEPVAGNALAPVPDSQPPTRKKPVGHSHAYLGISGAPDFSTVRFQSMKGIGTTFGLQLGYTFNDHWAVESGLYLDRKRYYTDGEYFNTSKVSMPTYSKLLNVDGTCYMWEIPVNVRYNLNKGIRIQWFATAGLSTYLMSKENYTYQYEVNWSVEESKWNIHRPSQYWFSIVNLSAGFEQRLGAVGNLRLEPYIRIPMSGVGTGKLAIMSAGLNVGLTRRLW